MSIEEIIKAFENLRYFESVSEVEWGRVQAEADRAIETLKQININKMGVDYTGHYGIGVKIELIDFDDENLDKEIAELECMSEVLEEKLDGDKYSWFEVGQRLYTGEDNDYYVEVDEPFKDGLNNLEEKRDELLKHLKEIGLEPSGEFGVVGGIEVN